MPAGKVVRIADVEGWMTDPPYDRELKVLLSPQLHAIRSVAIGLMSLAPGKTSGLHSHETAEEVWYIISGRGKARIGDDTYEVEPDMVVFGPPGIPHGYVNDGTETLRALFILSPAGDERRILEALARQHAAAG